MTPTADWVVMIPVRAAATAKSRLAPLGGARAQVARAVALDTITAVVQCPAVARVLVVTDDATLPAALPAGVEVVADGAEGIEEALRLAAALAGDDAHRAALPGDLPAVTGAELAAALERAHAVRRGVVADAEGTGTTLLTARAGVPWRSAYGAGSLGRHVALGCVVLELPADSGLRRDVDTPDQLAALADRLGPTTAASLTRATAGADAAPETPD